MRVGTRATYLSAAAIAIPILLAGAMIQGPGDPAFRVNAVFLLVFFGIPTQWLERPRDVRAEWLPLLVTTLTGTFAWDLATAFFAQARPFFAEWYLVYTSGPIVMMGLYLLHAFLADRLARTLYS